MAEHRNEIMNRVMIACVTDEVNMVVQPVRDYRIDRIHLINYVKPSDGNDTQKSKRSDFYRTVCDAVLDSLRELNPNLEIEQHTDSPTYKFEKMMKVVYGIIEDELAMDSKIYVNISSGSCEYAAAASIASMMHRGVQLFSVGGIPDSITASNYSKKIENISTKDGRIVGSYKDYYPPIAVEGFPLDPPDMNLIRSLEVFRSIEIKYRSNTNVIRRLILNGLWMTAAFADGDESKFAAGTSVELEDPITGKCARGNAEYTKLQRKEAVQYQRNFIEKWLQKGWIYKDRVKTGNKYDLTPAGKMYIDVFCPDSDY